VADSELLLDPHGRIFPLTDAVRTEIADRAGRFLLLPSAPDLLLAVRSPQGGGSAPAPGAVFVGDLGGMPAGDLLGFVHQWRATGVLRVAAGGILRCIAFRDGNVRAVTSASPAERIGQVAVRLGLVQARQVADAESPGRPIGRTLVERGHINASDLWRVLREQVATVFHALLVAREGVFWLTRGEPEEPEGGLTLDTQALLVDAIRRIDEMELFRQSIPDSGVYLRRREPRHQVALEAEEERLLALVDGQRDIAELARRSHLSEFEATKVVYRLLQGGWAEIAEGPARPVEPPVDPARAVAAGMNDIFREVAGAVASHGGAGPFRDGARAFLADPHSRFAPLWRGLVPGPDGALDVERLLGALASLPPPAAAGLEAGGDRARLLLTALRELMFFYLFQAGERLPRDADEAITRTVKSRLEVVEAQVGR
jgi:hypothetical protein